MNNKRIFPQRLQVGDYVKQGSSTHGPRSSLPWPTGHFEKLQMRINKK